MPEQPLVSIIVPIYNAQDHIARCVESIRRQTYQNLEILLLNDGSQDVSLEVCKMYANVDPRIVLIDKANSGVAATRNMGRHDPALRHGAAGAAGRGERRRFGHCALQPHYAAPPPCRG